MAGAGTAHAACLMADFLSLGFAPWACAAEALKSGAGFDCLASGIDHPQIDGRQAGHRDLIFARNDLIFVRDELTFARNDITSWAE